MRDATGGSGCSETQHQTLESHAGAFIKWRWNSWEVQDSSRRNSREYTAAHQLCTQAREMQGGSQQAGPGRGHTHLPSSAMAPAPA